MSEVVEMMDSELRARWEGLSLGYTDSRGDEQLLKEICRTQFELQSPGLGRGHLVQCLSLFVAPAAVATWHELLGPLQDEQATGLSQLDDVTDAQLRVCARPELPLVYAGAVRAHVVDPRLAVGPCLRPTELTWRA